jgi:hypothetical protein
LIIHTGPENPCGLWWKWLSATDLYQKHARSANSLSRSYSEAQPQCMSSEKSSIFIKCINIVQVYDTEFEVLTAVIMKNVVFWDVTPYSLENLYSLSTSCWFLARLLWPWNVSELLPDHTVLHPRRQYSS